MSSARPTEGCRAANGGVAAVLAAVCLAWGLTLSACSIRPPVEPGAGAAAAVALGGPARVRELTSALSARDRALDSMQTSAVMEYEGGGGQHVKAREEIVVRRPGSLRVEAMSPFGVALVVAANDAQIEIFDPSKNTLMRGAATAETLDRFVRIPMAPRSAVELLMALAPDDESVLAHADFVDMRRGMTVASYQAADGTRRELGFAGGQLAMVRSLGQGGRVRYEVRYSDYRDIGGMMFPYRLEADFPLVGSRLDLRYERPIINGGAPASLFVLTPGPATRLVTIGRAAAPARAASQG
jgi:hypothetical protein